MKKKTIILLWLVTAYSCSNYSSRLKAVLDYSGTNRAELEKVLDHYSQDPADSLLDVFFHTVLYDRLTA